MSQKQQLLLFIYFINNSPCHRFALKDTLKKNNIICPNKHLTLNLVEKKILLGYFKIFINSIMVSHTTRVNKDLL